MLTLFRPATGEIKAKGVTQTTNAILHPWFREQISEILADEEGEHAADNQNEEMHRQRALSMAREVASKITGRGTTVAEVDEEKRPTSLEGGSAQAEIEEVWHKWMGEGDYRGLPKPRLILIMDNLAGHRSIDLVVWLLLMGVMVLYTPIGGSWLNMAESVQRIIVSRALYGQHPKNAEEIIEWLEQTVKGWDEHPTPFTWDGKRRKRRQRARLKRLGGSGAAIAVAS